jgi:hypothetical protein
MASLGWKGLTVVLNPSDGGYKTSRFYIIYQNVRGFKTKYSGYTDNVYKWRYLLPHRTVK